VRSIKKPNQTNSPWSYGIEPFPKDLDGIIYVRQSSIVQMQKNIHSFEMQTDKFLEYFRNIGCTGQIDIIADDEAMSGTLDIHKRPGMSRMMQRIEEDGGKRLGWIGAVHVNRLTRDPWLITPAHLVKTCHDYNVWIATLRMNFNFNEPSGYSQRVFMMEAEESARHLEWMKLILGGGKITASANGYYDGRPVAPGYSVDRSDPERKKYIVYPPFAPHTLWLYERFVALDFNFFHLCQEVAAMPYLYPPLEAGVKVRLAIKPIADGAYAGCYKPSRGGLVSILTNPAYIGW
jgi:DNA invertase Pin-like site-specific DNA recombinase